MSNLRDEKRLQLRAEIRTAILNLYREGYTWLEIIAKMEFKSPNSLQYYVKDFTAEDRRTHMIGMATRRLDKLKSTK